MCRALFSTDVYWSLALLGHIKVYLHSGTILSGFGFLPQCKKPVRMVVPPPDRAARIVGFLKPYLLRMHFSNKYVTAQVIHTPTATVACSASSQEKLLRPNLESTRDVSAAAKIGKLLGERLLLKGIPAVSIHMKREQKYHGKVKAVIDSVRESGVKLL
ncbi:50S ribosomal protein L18-like isoform X1 [Triticum dicoccoides]|nr:50S ribosomal protein L18-like isoform X1 [Triticum dicoccoides]XP_044348386.1 50S ribosomal protein L18-like [Triticum aestivum]